MCAPGRAGGKRNFGAAAATDGLPEPERTRTCDIYRAGAGIPLTIPPLYCVKVQQMHTRFPTGERNHIFFEGSATPGIVRRRATSG